MVEAVAAGEPPHPCVELGPRGPSRGCVQALPDDRSRATTKDLVDESIYVDGVVVDRSRHSYAPLAARAWLTGSK